MKQIILEQPRRGNTHEVQLTPHKAEGRNVGRIKAYAGRSVERTTRGRNVWIATVTLLLVILATACSKPENEALTGAWQWTSTCGGIAGVQYTPGTEGFNVEIVFKGNQFTFYKDGEKITSGVYSIDYNVDETYYINKGEGDEPFYSWFRFHISETHAKKISEATNGKINLMAPDPDGLVAFMGYNEAEGQVLSLSDGMYDGFTCNFIKKDAGR